MSAQSALTWYWNRLRCMSPGELAHRIERTVKARLERRGLGTAKVVPGADVSTAGKAFVPGTDAVSREPYVSAAEDVLAGRLHVFALDYVAGQVPRWNRDPKTGREAPMVFGKTLNYRDESLVGDIKYLWEPNRHLHLVTLAQAWRLTGDQRYLDGLRRQLDSWFDQCPYPRGPNWTSSLELAIRLINWSIVWQLVGANDSPMFAGADGLRLRGRWLDSIYRHMHFVRGHLSRFSSANNHLIGEAAGLFVAAVTWPHWGECRRWARDAHSILEREATLQNAPDGVNREQAISYQQFVLDFLLLAALAGRFNQLEFSVAYWKRIEAMLEYLASVMDKGGNVPMLGDADDGYALRLSQEREFCPYRSLLATGAVLFGRSEFKAKAGTLDDKTRWLLGSVADDAFRHMAAEPAALPVRRAFKDGGYYVLGTDFETQNEIRLVVDCGPLGYLSIAAHGHADALAFTLSAAGREFLVDPGTFAYHTEKKWRDYFRSTAAHNTAVIDGVDQSTIGGNFMWLQKASAHCETWQSSADEDRFAGWHDGYTRLDDPVVHRRELLLDKRARRLYVNDTLDCRGRHSVSLHWHFSEHCDVQAQTDTVIASTGGARIVMKLPAANGTLELVRGDVRPRGGWISRRFDVKAETATVIWTGAIEGVTRLQTTIDVHTS